MVCIINSSIKHQSLVCTQLNDQTVQFLTIQFSISHLFALNFNVKFLFDWGKLRYKHLKSFSKYMDIALCRAYVFLSATWCSKRGTRGWKITQGAGDLQQAWHIHCWLLNAKSDFIHRNSSISNNVWVYSYSNQNKPLATIKLQRKRNSISCLRVFGLLSSSSLLFPQCFGRYVLRPSSGVTLQEYLTLVPVYG